MKQGKLPSFMPLKPSCGLANLMITSHTLASCLALNLNSAWYCKVGVLLAISAALITALLHWKRLSRFSGLRIEDTTFDLEAETSAPILATQIINVHWLGKAGVLLILRQPHGQLIRLPLLYDSVHPDDMRHLKQFIQSRHAQEYFYASTSISQKILARLNDFYGLTIKYWKR